MKVSIIIPVYNKQKYLKKSIQSILEQTYDNFELIIVNDGSTDNSSEICHNFQKIDQRVRVIDIDNNGVSNARNVGVSNANGDYIQFIDADDYTANNMLENLVNIAKIYNPDVIVNGIEKINEKNESVGKILPIFDGMTDIEKFMVNFAEVQKQTGIYGYVHNKFIRKSIIDNNNLLFDKDIWLAEDLDFCLDLYSNISSIYFCKDIYYYYLQEAENSSTTSKKKHNYLQQGEIILKEKEMLDYKNALNNNNLGIVNSVITNFIMSYIHQQFNYNYHQFIKDLDVVTNNDKFIDSIDCNCNNKFTNRVMKLLLKDKKTSIYILFFTRTVLRDIYRKIKK